MKFDTQKQKGRAANGTEKTLLQGESLFSEATR